MNHTWRHKSTHQQICSRCGQVRRWNGTRWLYRKQGQLVRQRPTCGEKRTDSERYVGERLRPCHGCTACNNTMSCCGCRHGYEPWDNRYAHHICDPEGPCDGSGVLPARKRTDSERYAELRALVETWQKNLGQAHKDALIQWRHR